PGSRLQIMRVPTEGAPEARLADLRGRFFLPPATLGQLLDRLAIRGLVALTADPTDRRRRVVRLTDRGNRVVRDAPLAGPVRLRQVPEDARRLRRLSRALNDAIVLFGLEDYTS